eukprot:gene5944-33520_t
MKTEDSKVFFKLLPVTCLELQQAWQGLSTEESRTKFAAASHRSCAPSWAVKQLGRKDKNANRFDVLAVFAGRSSADWLPPRVIRPGSPPIPSDPIAKKAKDNTQAQKSTDFATLPLPLPGVKATSKVSLLQPVILVSPRPAPPTGAVESGGIGTMLSPTSAPSVKKECTWLSILMQCQGLAKEDNVSFTEQVADVLNELGLSPLEVTALDSKSLDKLVVKLNETLAGMPDLPVRTFGVHLQVADCLQKLLSDPLPGRLVLASAEKSAKDIDTVSQPMTGGKRKKVPTSFDVPASRVKVAKQMARTGMKAYPSGTHWKDIKDSDAIKRLKTEFFSWKPAAKLFRRDGVCAEFDDEGQATEHETAAGMSCTHIESGTKLVLSLSDAVEEAIAVQVGSAEMVQPTDVSVDGFGVKLVQMDNAAIIRLERAAEAYQIYWMGAKMADSLEPLDDMAPAIGTPIYWSAQGMSLKVEGGISADSYCKSLFLMSTA